MSVYLNFDETLDVLKIPFKNLHAALRK